MGLSIFDETFPLFGQGSLSGDSTASVYYLVDQQPGPTRVDTVMCCNQDSIAHTFLVRLGDGVSIDTQLGFVTVPARAGCDGNVVFELLTALGLSDVQMALPSKCRISFQIQEVIVDAVGVFLNQWGGLV